MTQQFDFAHDDVTAQLTCQFLEIPRLEDWVWLTSVKNKFLIEKEISTSSDPKNSFQTQVSF